MKILVSDIGIVNFPIVTIRNQRTISYVSHMSFITLFAPYVYSFACITSYGAALYIADSRDQAHGRIPIIRSTSLVK